MEEDFPVLDLKSDRVMNRFLFLTIVLGGEVLGNDDNEIKKSKAFDDDYSHLTTPDIKALTALITKLSSLFHEEKEITLHASEMPLFYVMINITARAFALLDMELLRRLGQLEDQPEDFFHKSRKDYLQCADDMIRTLHDGYGTNGKVLSEIERLSQGKITMVES